MFDAALAFTRYRLEAVRSWPDCEAKDKLLAALESSLRKSNLEQDQAQRTARSKDVAVYAHSRQ
jgi:hypothetical protein